MSLRGSFSDRRFENGGQCGRTCPSHILGGCPHPGGQDLETLYRRPIQISGGGGSASATFEFSPKFS